MVGRQAAGLALASRGFSRSPAGADDVVVVVIRAKVSRVSAPVYLVEWHTGGRDQTFPAKMSSTSRLFPPLLPSRNGDNEADVIRTRAKRKIYRSREVKPRSEHDVNKSSIHPLSRESPHHLGPPRRLAAVRHTRHTTNATVQECVIQRENFRRPAYKDKELRGTATSSTGRTNPRGKVDGVLQAEHGARRRTTQTSRRRPLARTSFKRWRSSARRSCGRLHRARL